jgi:putative ABC transport system substrate-binding protein
MGMKRRDFITLFGGAAVAPALGPLAARAQQPAMPMVGFLHTRSKENLTPSLTGFAKGLADGGYDDGRSVKIEYRFVDGQYERLPAMAAELVDKQVAVFVAGGGEASVLAAKAATATIPVVFVMGSDPVKAGLVASYNRPGGNITGINILTDTLEAKRIGLMHQLMPMVKTIGYLWNPKFTSAQSELRDVQEAARSLGIEVRVLSASSEPEIDAAFETIKQEQILALTVCADPFLSGGRNKNIALASHYKVPAIYEFREHALAGGLMSYGIDIVDAYRQAGVYAARILKGEKPASLPVLQPTKFEFLINLKTAKTLGLEVPPTLLALADEVIE